MTTIDQRILIPSPPEVVWEYISDIRNNPRWVADCTSVVFLTSKVAGPGTRWRQAIDRSGEQVIEVTAWYEGLGYQYTYVDGVPFREGTGRIRLQEIPEGTVVQWTITYEMGGLLGGVRSSLGVSRKLEAQMVVSLKNLWKQVNESGSAQRVREAKSLMREAPDAEARANYKPRHTPVVDLRAEGDGEHAPPTPVAPPPVEQDADAKFRPPAGHVIAEPPIAEDDTRPRQIVEPVAPVEPVRPAEPIRPRQTIDDLVAESEEPEFLQDMQRYAPPAPPVVDDTQPVRPVTGDVAAESHAEPAPDFMDEFTLDESDFAPPKPAEPAPSLTDEINALVYQPESWDEPADEADVPVRLTDEINALVAETETSGDEQSAQSPSLTDEINALVTEADSPEREIRLTDEINALVVDPEVAAEAPSEPISAAPVDEAEASESDDSAPAEAPAPPETPHRIDESSFPPPSTTDTSKMSIWEIFGVPRPSETGVAEAVEEASAETPGTPEDKTDVETPAAEAPAAESEPVEALVSEATEAAALPADEPPMPDMAVSTGELTIVEVIREVSGPPRRTGLRAKMRKQSRKVRDPQ